MTEIADRYHAHYASDMIEVTHAENGAWEKIWNNGKGYNQRIDYRLVVENTDEEQYIMTAAKEYTALLEQVGSK